LLVCVQERVTEETVWLGDIPVATLRPNGSGVSIYYVHSDQLNTPRQVTRPSDNAQMWTWFSDPFGTDAANANPAGAGAFAYNLRFAGQVFDGQAGLHQNGFRDFDPAMGRYQTSDPSGLAGGINTYAYAGGNPLNFTDPLGLAYGDFPSLPPGFDEGWSVGQFPNGRWYLTDPSETRWIAHPEDFGHWRHWDKQGPGGKDQGTWPPNSKKMWPLQKKPKADQCEADPSGDAPPWSPPDNPNFFVPWLGPEWPAYSPQPSPLRIPFRVPLLGVP
jgi:RHS repeat-associated protein